MKAHDERFTGVSKAFGLYGEHDFGQYYFYYEQYVSFFESYLKAKSKVLEVGCANGPLVSAMRDHGFEAFGLDVSDFAIAQAPSRVKSYLEVCDLDRWQPIAMSYDGVIALGVLEYLSDLPKVMKNISSTLGKNSQAQWFFLKTLGKRSFLDKYRKNCHSKKYWIDLAASCGLQYDASTSKAFRNVGFQALHEFSIRYPNSFGKKIYQFFSKVFGNKIAAFFLRRLHPNLLFLAFKKN